MSNRERIILVAMGLVVFYGIYSVFFSSSPKMARVKATKSSDETRKFVADVANSLKDDPSEQQLYILSQARAEWNKDPFLETKRPQPADIVVKNTQEAKTTPEVNYAYTGYLQMGKRKLAIINGIEYELGNELESKGHIVKEIEPLRVVIGPPDNNDTNMILLLDETKESTQ